jgi:hypothetical protein
VWGRQATGIPIGLGHRSQIPHGQIHYEPTRVLVQERVPTTPMPRRLGAGDTRSDSFVVN